MKTWNKIAVASGLSAAAILTGAAAQAQDCQPGLNEAFQQHAQVYGTLKNALVPEVSSLDTQLKAMVDQTTYQTLLDHCNTIAAGITAGRMVITLPDGTVVIDTNRTDNDPNDPKSNSYQHFLDKTINENHNSRVAIFSAQQYPCGRGLETKFSTSDGTDESYLALRLGTHLDSEGTARISTKQ